MMSNRESIPERKLRIATRVFTSSKGNQKLSDTMKIAGYETPERKGGTIYQCVRRAAQKIQKKLYGAPSNVPPSVECNPSAIGTDNLSLPFNYIAPLNSNSSLSPASTAFNLTSRRSLSSELSSPVNIKRRQRSKENQQDDATKIRLKKIESNAMKLETARIKVSFGLPTCRRYKKYTANIVRKINLEHVSDISCNIAIMIVLQGIIG